MDELEDFVVESSRIREKKWDTIKNRSLTGRKRPVARPCTSTGYESFLMPPHMDNTKLYFFNLLTMMLL